jgi:TIR domain
VSMTFDPLLAQALDEERFQGAKRTQTIAYSEKTQVEDLPADFEKLPHPTVFQLLGKLEATGDYGITEEKILEFSHRLQSRDFRPKNLFDALRARNLIAVGCNLPTWLTRLFLRASKGDQLFTQGARGLIADRTSQLDTAFVMFLERRRTALYPDGDAVQFVEELHRRWMERFGHIADSGPIPVVAMDAPSAIDFRPDSVFISYASDDRQQAERVKQAFDEAGVDAWFDQSELRSGDDFRLKIERSIENCSYFVPLISSHTARMEKRFFWREWNKAIDEARAYPPNYPFIQPILLDDTPLPPEFGTRHYRKIDQLTQLIDDAKKRIRERRVQRRPA